MKFSKRYPVLAILVLIAFLIKFKMMDNDSGILSEFRGGTLHGEAWFPLIAEDVNSKELKIVIDNKEYSAKNYTFYMDKDRNIMVPVDVLRDALDCSAHVYNEGQLLVEKHNSSIWMQLSGKEDELYYISLNELATKLGYECSFDMTNNMFVAFDMAEDRDALPAKYDLRERLRISQIRNQGRYGTCWAFAALGAIESTLMPEESSVFSVDHMSMNSAYAIEPTDGGNYLMSMAYLAAWQGPVYEADDPYADGITDSTLRPVKHVQEMRLIASKDFRGIKEAIFKYGGVQTSIYTNMEKASDASKYYNKETFAYCYIGTQKPNHEVVIIGWDDNYSKNNFAMELEGDGAFICQNSWGDSFGEEGIFYVSYYDSNIATHNVVYSRVESNDNYDNIYQSDLCGWVGKIGYDKESMYGANVYTAKKNENIVAASFYATGVDTEYKVYVVREFEDTASFAKKELVAEGTLSDAGYYTIDFERPMAVSAGERYAVVVYVKTPGATHPMALEYNSGTDALSKVDLEDGESYISYSGYSFSNIKEKQEGNLCIKAFTNDR